jgi:hypothetical protein
MYSVLGYDDVLTTSKIRARYERGGIAGRIVDAMPKATWREGFQIIEDENPDISSKFELAVKALDSRLELSAKFMKVDVLASLSTFAVLLIGTADGQLDQPLPKGNGKPDGIIFLQPYSGGGGLRGKTVRNRTIADDADCLVESYVTDAKDPRYGLPQTYQLRRVNAADVSAQRVIHHTRILHVAHDTLDDNVYGAPTLERVWNLLDDLDKVTGGGAEAFWLRANQGTALKVDADAALSPDEKAQLKTEVEEWHHQIRRFMVMRKTELQTLGSDVTDFGGPADAILTQIAGAKAIPKRILTGSEMGQLASSQDRENWRDQVHGRQKVEAGPYIIKPFIQRLLDFNYLPQPKIKGVWKIEWPVIDAMTEDEKSSGALKWSQTKMGDGKPVFSEAEIREKWYGLEPLPAEVQAAIEEGQAAVAPEETPVADAAVESNTPELPAALTPKTPAELIAASDKYDTELLRVLEAAIEVGNTDVIDRILGVSHTKT